MNEDGQLDELPNEGIPVLSNIMISKMISQKKIIIDHFEPDRLGPTSYKLLPYRLRFHIEDDDGVPLTDQVIALHPGKGRELRPDEYTVASPREKILLTEGFIVDFYPSSWCIENKLMVTMGRLDAGYGSDIVFGIFNAGRSDVRLDNSFQLARATFGWMGHNNMPSYKGTVPGAYIPKLEKLREREAALDSAEEALRLEREKVSRDRAELLRKSNL